MTDRPTSIATATEVSLPPRASASVWKPTDGTEIVESLTPRETASLKTPPQPSSLTSAPVTDSPNEHSIIIISEPADPPATSFLPASQPNAPTLQSGINNNASASGTAQGDKSPRKPAEAGEQASVVHTAPIVSKRQSLTSSGRPYSRPSISLARKISYGGAPGNPNGPVRGLQREGSFGESDIRSDDRSYSIFSERQNSFAVQTLGRRSTISSNIHLVRQESMVASVQMTDENEIKDAEVSALLQDETRLWKIVYLKMKLKVNRLFDSKIYFLFTMLLTFFALFNENISILWLPESSDRYFIYLFSLFLFLFFGMEFILSSIFVNGYFLSFFFWMDLLVLITLVPDFLLFFNRGTSVRGFNKFLRNSRTARVGTRVSRLMRVSRVVRWIFKTEEGQDKNLQPNIIRRKFGDQSVRKLIGGVILMLIIPPLLQDQSISISSELEHSLKLLEDTHRASQNGTISIESYNYIVKSFVDINEKRILQLKIFDDVPYHKDIGEYRDGIEIITIDTDESTLVLSVRDKARLSAILDIVMIVFVILLLAAAIVLVNRDLEEQFMQPLERMTRLVDNLASNPLQLMTDQKKNTAAPVDDEEWYLETILRKISALLRVGFGEAGAQIITSNINTNGSLDPMVPGAKVSAIYGFCDIRNFTDITESLREDVMVFVNQVAAIVHQAVTDSGGSPNKNIGDAFLCVWKFRTGNPKDSSALTDFSSSSATSSEKELADRALMAFVGIYEAILASKELQTLHHKYPKLRERLPNFGVRLGFGLHVGWSIEGAIGSESKIDASYLSPHVNLSARLESATKFYGVPILLSGHFYSMLSPLAQARCRKLDRVTLKGSSVPLTLYAYDFDDEIQNQGQNQSSPRRKSKTTKRLSMNSNIEYRITIPLSVVDEGQSFSYTQSTTEQSATEPSTVSHPLEKNDRAAGYRATPTENVSPSRKQNLVIHSPQPQPQPQPQAREEDDVVVDELDRNDHESKSFLTHFESAVNDYIHGKWELARGSFELCLKKRPNDGPSSALVRYMESNAVRSPSGEWAAPKEWRGYRVFTEK